MKWMAYAPIAAASLVLAFGASRIAFPQGDEWISKIRKDHPRIFFNRDTWPAIKERALAVEKEHFEKVKKHAETPQLKPDWWSGGKPDAIKLPETRPGSSVPARDWGEVLMSAAFVYRIEPTPERLKRIKDMLWASLDYYHACYAAGKSINWYSRSQVGWLAAFDWVWDDLSPDERREMGQSMLKHIDEVLRKPGVLRRNSGGHTTGYYGERNATFFAGVCMLNEGIDDAKALEFLKEGYGVYQKLFAHRSESSGDDGGGASPTIGYTFVAYPWAEWNFLYTWQAATGEDIAGRWPYIAMFPNYVMWNMLPNMLEYGYGDTPHTANPFPQWWIYTHMSQIMHFYGTSQPDLAALAAYVRSKVPVSKFPSQYSVYPFLTTNLEKAPPPQDPKALPMARYFENMGQIFMRSGDGPDDAYCLFACGGMLAGHRHYDAVHFTIYKKGFLALDTGTREGNTDNLQNYFAQTVAHNCVLIKMPGEPPSPYWNGTVYGQAGGQNKQIGSKVVAFETGPDYTYMTGDATPVYNEKKCALMVRQFVFIPPDYFVVCDRVTSTNADYGKTWLLHHANEPMVEGKTWRSDQDKGRIFCRTLLPKDAVLEKVGGPGKEFMADGANYSITAGPAKWVAETGSGVQTLKYKDPPELMGRWRMEAKPGSPRTEDVFLHLIQVGDQSLEVMVPSELIEEDGRVGVAFAVGDKTVRITFAATGAPSGRVKIAAGDKVVVDKAMVQGVMPQSGLGAAAK
ncbi:MAG: heparinase II/III family protein [Planctomycetota bacterium]